MLADGDDGFGWSEGRQAQQPPPEDPASITQRLIDEELAKIEKEKAELDAEKTRLLGEKRLELTRPAIPAAIAAAGAVGIVASSFL